MHQRVVLATGDGELRNRLFEALGPFSAEAVEVPSAARALELTHEIPVHLLVVHYPIQDMKFREFIDALRDCNSASRAAQLLTLAPGRSIGGLKRSAGTGVAIVKSDSDLETLEQTFTTFLRRSPRFEENLLVGVDLELTHGKVRKMLQVKNISESGMLLRAKTPLALGLTFTFELQIPELKRPIAGEGEVVRVVELVEGARMHGVGVKFVHFVGDSREKLAKFLRIRRLPAAMTQ